MGMVGIADGVFALGHIDRAVLHHLDVLAVDNAFILGGFHILDAGLAGIEIVVDLLHLVGFAVLGHHRAAHPLFRQAVVDAVGEHGTCIHVVLHIFGCKLHIVVLDGYVAVVVDFALAVGEDFQDGVSRSGEGRCGEGTFAEHLGGVSPVEGIGPAYGIPAGKSGAVGSVDLLFNAHTVSLASPAGTP